jgi:hypothetical protein
MQSFYNLVYIRTASIVPVLVCMEVLVILILYRKKHTFKGQNFLICGIMCFLLAEISNFLTSFGFFLIKETGNTFSIHPLIFWGQTPVFLLGCLTCGIGAYRWYLHRSG